ncbi:cell surface protein [Sporosarcina globispora]|uniref:Cell surface protein n=1 Tax=Sporosarcina globispora TaxID=1459 RepID=A0A0M0G934_SPOGL|nr:MupG family TIM beta-alpha barrel fold protein [Sporosarcina globispora]KON86354.1 cell surface protein [Sporosarcina globispora]
MLGISVYLSEERQLQNAKWIERAASYGLKSIFTSLHIPEDDHSTYKHLLQDLGALAKQYQMELLADVSPQSLGHLGLDWDSIDTLLEWGLSGIRADYGFTSEQIVELSKKMKLGINASTISAEELQEWMELGLNANNVEAWHNFYPRPETGLDKAFLIERNRFLKSMGITTMAFVPGDGEFRGPVFVGLPTLEKHRGYPPAAAAAELMNSCYTDKVLIGDHSGKDETLAQLAKIAEGAVPLRIELISRHFCGDLFNKIHTNRMDPARDVVRSVESRSYASKGSNKWEPINQLERKKGSVTVDNILYGRYAGEMQITLADLPRDERVNVIARVIEEDMPLLDQIRARTKFQLIVRDYK